MLQREKTVALISLLTGAIVWGLIWYPYRQLESAGLSGIGAATSTYFVALVFSLLLFWRSSLRRARPSWILVWIGLAAGGANFGYVVATLHGEVMRVLLLFYMAPLWTVLLSRPLLGERLNMAGAVVILLSLSGAATMLWQPQFGAPLPGNGAEWLGLFAGFLFALSNILVRKADGHCVELKSFAVFVGVVLLGSLVMLIDSRPALLSIASAPWLSILLVGFVLMLVNLIVQYGLMRVSANRAIVIFLFELLVAAISSWLLANEVMSVREWLGGGLIVAASLFSGQIEADQRDSTAVTI